MYCDKCSAKLTYINFYCDQCSNQISSTNRQVSELSYDNIEIDTVNIHNAFLCLQGKQNICLPNDLISKLDNYFNIIGVKNTKTIKRDYLGRTIGTSLESMNLALKTINYS